MKKQIVKGMRFLGLALLVSFCSELALTQTQLIKKTEFQRISSTPEVASAPSLAIASPTLKWAYGGCFSSWCQTGWYSSPAVADINGDGKQEVLWGSYDLVAVSGAEGKLLWRASSDNRVWPGVALADLTGDGTSEIIVGRSGGQLAIYNGSGGVVWTTTPFADGSEIRSLAVEDLDQDGQLEIIVGKAGSGSTKQINVITANGTVRPGGQHGVMVNPAMAGACTIKTWQLPTSAAMVGKKSLDRRTRITSRLLTAMGTNFPSM